MTGGSTPRSHTGRRFAFAAMVLSCSAAEAEARQAPFCDVEEAARFHVPGPVASLLVGRDGMIYAARPRVPSIRIHQPAGRLVAEIELGRPEAGVLETVALLGWHHDEIYAIDESTRRVAFFREDGSFTRVIELALPGGVIGGSPVQRILADGSGVVVRPYVHPPQDRSPVVRIDRRGEVLDTLAWLPHGVNRLTLDLSGSVGFTAQPFQDRSVVLGFAADGSSFVIVDAPPPADAETAWFAVARISEAGDTIFRRRFPYVPAAIAEKEFEAAIAGVVSHLAAWRQEPAESIEAKVRKAIRRPGFRNPIFFAFVGRDGSVWLMREAAANGPRDWIVLDESGTESMRLRTPRELVVHEADRRRLWGVFRGPRGDVTEPRAVVVYRVGCEGDT